MDEEPPNEKIIDLQKVKWRREDEQFEKVNAQIREEIFGATRATMERHSDEIIVVELALDWTIVSAVYLAHSLGMSRKELIQQVNDLADEFEPKKEN